MHVHVSNCAQTSTSLCLHKYGSTGLFHTSSCWKHFDFLIVEVQGTVAHNQGFAHLCSLFHILLNWNINDLLRLSRFPNTYHAYQIQQLKHRLCVLLNHAVPAMDSFHGVTPRIRTNQSGTSYTVGFTIACSSQHVACVNTLIPIVCSSCACSRDNVSV